MARDYYLTGSGQKLINIHTPEACVPPCVIHSPLDGPWRDWRTHFRPADTLDRLFGMYKGFERICPHGVGHPAAEEYSRQSGLIHGCDGCPCVPGKEPDGH